MSWWNIHNILVLWCVYVCVCIANANMLVSQRIVSGKNSSMRCPKDILTDFSNNCLLLNLYSTIYFGFLDGWPILLSCDPWSGHGLCFRVMPTIFHRDMIWNACHFWLVGCVVFVNCVACRLLLASVQHCLDFFLPSCLMYNTLWCWSRQCFRWEVMTTSYQLLISETFEALMAKFKLV